MRTSRLLVVLALVVSTVPLWIEPAGATAGPSGSPTQTTTTTTSRPTWVCSVTPPFAEPRTQDYTITVTVPTRVAPGGTADIHVTVDYPTQPIEFSTIGAVSVVAHQGDDVTQHLITVPGNTFHIDGSASFPVTGAAGTAIVWEIQNFGQVATFNGSRASEVCRPKIPVPVADTLINHGFLDRFPALVRLLEHVCSIPRFAHVRFIAFLCALLTA